MTVSATRWFRLTAAGAWFAFCMIGGSAYISAQGPLWWEERGVVDNQATPNDFAPVNQGQAKNLATAAAGELLENLPQGVDSGIWQLVDPWRHSSDATNDFAPVNLGQLKRIAQPFYDLLIQVGYWSGDYPWIGAGSPNDFALANIGQAKNLFAFDVAFDSGSGIPDWWEIKWFGQSGAPGDPDPAHIEAYLEGRDPLAESIAGPLGQEEVELEVFLPL